MGYFFCTNPNIRFIGNSISAHTHVIILAYGLMPAFIAMKVYLAAGYWYSQGTDAANGTPAIKWILFLGTDALLCLALSVLYLIISFVSRGLLKRTRLNIAILFVIHSSVVLFSVVSLKINQIYGSPLTVFHLRMAEDLTILRGSIASYIDAPFVLLLVFGLACFPLALFAHGRWIGTWKMRRWLFFSGLALLSVSLSVGSYANFRGINTFGLEKNAIVHFIRYYAPLPEVQDYRAMAATLRTRIPDSFDFFSPLHTKTPASYQDKNYSGIAAGQNVLLIILESTEREHINPQTTPNLFKLQQQSIIFTNYFTTAVNSLQAKYGIFYSDHLGDYSVVGFPRQIYNGPPNTTSLPEVLHQAGYLTSVFFSGFLSYQDMGYLWNQKGVDDVYGAQTVLGMSGETGWFWGAFETQTVKILGEWIKRDRIRPFFAVYIPVYPHHPYFTPVSNPPFPVDSWRNRFRNALHYVDQSVGLLLNYLDRAGMRSNTSIIVVSDHGETLDPARAGHGIRMDLAEIQVPLFIHNPNLFDRRIVRSVPANHLDLAPTIAGLLGIASSPDWLGRNLLSSSVSPRMLYVQRNCLNQQSAIVDGEMLFVRDDNAALEYMYYRREENKKNLARTPARLRLMKEYRKSARHFEDFVVLRHLERASRRLE